MGHAVCSASGSHRWLNCTKSARLELNFGESESAVAAEGTAAHALCEHKLRKTLKLKSKRPVSQYDNDEMDEYTDGYVAFVLEVLTQIKHKCKDPIILIEQKLDLSYYVPEGSGTCDTLIVGDGILHIFDFKYGQGIVVEAEDNPQMKLYALGALELFESLYDIKEVVMTIYQPRRENVSTWTVAVLKLKAWAEEVLKPKAKMAFIGEGEYFPGKWCTFCKASVKCRARAEENLKLAALEFALPPLLTDSEIEVILSSLDDLTKWANEIIAYVTNSAINNGKRWNGFKLVEGRSVRKYTNETAVAEAVIAAGYIDIYKQSLINLTEMEKLMGKAKFNEILGGLVYKPSGKLTLVPISDKRQEVNVSNVNDDFKEDI